MDVELEGWMKAMEERVTNAEQRLARKDDELIVIIREVVGWHTHAFNGKIYWELPDEIKQAQVEQLRKIFGNKKTVKQDENIPKPEDELSFKLTPAGLEQ